MKICFPVSRENDGQPYQATDDKSLQAMLAKLRSEPNGAWLVGANGLWHGGVHLSDRASAPYAKLTPDLLQQNKVMPLRCMAEGEVVAYRLNKAYLEAPYFRDEQLKYSSTFALVKSEYKAQDETLLTFYSLYMHLAPVSDYPAYPRYRTIVQRTLNTHRFTANNEGQYGIPSDVTERGERRDYDIPPKHGALKHGDEFLVYQTADFFMTTIISTRYDKVRFGLAQKLEGGVVKDEKKFWVELHPQFVEQTGEACPQMPVWMQTAVKKGAFDSVQTLTGDEVIRINAGDPIGHLGLFESPAARLPDRMSYYFTHIEVLSADDNLPDFVNNTKHLADGRKYVICGLDQMLHSYDATHKTFTPLKVRTQQEIVLAKALTSPVKDKNGVNWYKVTQTGWVKQNGELVTEVDQHDLNKLGFRLLEEEATTDFSKLTAEECVKVLLRHLLVVAKQDRRIDHALVPVRYERILRKLDKDGDGQLNAQEVRLGLYNPEMINVVTRFIVKHSSEWYENSQGGPWENFFTNVVKNRTANKFWRQYLDDQVWMKAVEPFNSGKPVWHMHPVVFLDALKCESATGISEDGLRFIFNIESLKGVSNHLHWPRGASGVTLGPGYDMKERSQSSIKETMRNIGLDSDIAEKISKGAGLTNNDASNFARDNRNLVSLTAEQETKLLKYIVPAYEDLVRRKIKVPLRQNQFDALVSFAYNPGGRFNDVTRFINNGEVNNAMEEMKKAVTSGGVVVNGLVNRRKYEVNLYTKGDYR
ncbi:glycoside hydrolase family protein [Photorhabdus hainanensis]|uniref:glycoside hydrolase family protein n=1 Tax=Photorhabdus hainanensis TaxID=1004166 RepID=UPI001FEADFEE|nr:glycoside hydrolase family protein [Photorhabdus hainanensis]